MTNQSKNEITNPYYIVQQQIEQAAAKLDIPDHVVEVLKRPQRVLYVTFPVKMDDGSIRVFEGYRFLNIMMQLVRQKVAFVFILM